MENKTNTESKSTKTTCCGSPRTGFFRRLFAKWDSSLKEKAEKGGSCCGSDKDGGKGDKCC